MLLKDFRYDIVTAIRHTLHEGETLLAPSLHLQLSVTLPHHLHVSMCLSLTLPNYPQIYRHCLHVVKQGQWRSVCWLSITPLTKHCVPPGNKQSGCRRLSGQIICGPVSHPKFQRWVWYLVTEDSRGMSWYECLSLRKRKLLCWEKKTTQSCVNRRKEEDC